MGRAWQLRKYDDPLTQFYVNGFIVNCKGYHPLWEWWGINIVSLQEAEGFPPPVLHYPEAEYELIIVSLDPEYDIDIDAIEAGKDYYRFLEPPDLCEQFHGITRDQAAKLAHLVVTAVLHGETPDQDNRAYWRQAMWGAIEHLRTEGQHLPTQTA